MVDDKEELVSLVLEEDISSILLLSEKLELEDDELLRGIVAFDLRSFATEIITAADGKEAFELAGDHKFLPGASYRVFFQLGRELYRLVFLPSMLKKS